MTEPEVFEARLRSALGRYVAGGPTSFDARGFAAAVAAAEPRRRRGLTVHWPSALIPRLAWLVALTALLLAALVGSTLLGGSHPTTEPSSWQRITLPGSEGQPLLLHDVLATDAGYLAVGGGGYLTPGHVWTSANGLSWNEVPTGPLFARAVLRTVIRTDAAYVAAGMDTSSGYIGAPGIWVSFDGVTWRAASSVDREYDAIIEHLASANGRQVAFGRPPLDGYRGQPMIWVADDADTWEAIADAPPGMGTIDGVVAGGPGFVAVGSSGVWTSADGRGWMRASAVVLDPSNVWPALVAVGADGRFVAAGAGGRFLVSDDAVTWTAHELPGAGGPGEAPQVVGLVATSWGYVAVSASPTQFAGALRATSATLWTSRDGATWQAHDLGTIPDLDCVSCTDLFAAGDTLITSARGGDWALPGAESPNAIP